MKKLEKIAQQEQKAREKIAAMQALLKQIDGQRTEQENLQIVRQIRALNLSRDELYAFMSGGELPPALAGAIAGDTAAEPEQIYSRRDRKRGKKNNNEPDTTDEPQTDTPEGETTHPESEGMNHEG